MIEELANYLPIEQQTRQLELRLQAISTDPNASHWLKRAVTELWVAGWMWGKYPEQATGYRLPQDETEAGEWLEGFRWGTTEACQFHRLWEWLDETL